MHGGTGHRHGRIPVEAHRQRVADAVASIAGRPPVAMSFADALAHPERLGPLASEIVSPIDLPPFDNSQMDGFAVRAAELAGASAERPVTLPVSETIAAGHAPGALPPGHAAPIMTGAPVPAGADAVVPVEQALPARFPPPGARDATIAFAAPVDPGRFVRPRGSDVRTDESLLAAGSRLGPAQWGVLAASGITAVEVITPLRVLLVSTGLELADDPGVSLAPGKIHDANGVSVALALAATGAEVTTARLANDEPEALLAALAAHPDADLLVSTGGVSEGAFEVVREVLEPRGVWFGSIAMQPGGPQGTGIATLDDGRALPVVAFPGNPVSALVSFEMFLRPLLRARTGLTPAHRPSELLRLSEPVESPPLHQVRRGLALEDGSVALIGGPSSHLLHAYARANALVHLPPDARILAAGDEVEVWRI